MNGSRDPALAGVARPILSARPVSRRHLRVFLRQLATLLDARLPVDRALGLLYRQPDAPAAASLADRLGQRVRQGGTLSDAMAEEPKVFDALDLSVVRAAETSGRLAEAVGRLLDYHQRRDAVSERVRTALIYPVILVIVAVLAITVLFVVVVPGLEPLLAGSGRNLPPATRMVLAVSDFLRHHGWVLLAIPAVMIAGAALPAGRNARDRFGLSLPLIGRLWSSIETERWQRGLGILLANGVSLPQAARVVAEGFANRVLRASGTHIAEAIPQGRGLAVLMAECGCFSAIAVQLVRVGEETGKLGDMLLRSADHQHEEVEQALTRMIGLIEPVLILILGIAVAAVVLALLSTITSLNETLVGA
jgi:type II secretory pathway component PulF